MTIAVAQLHTRTHSTYIQSTQHLNTHKHITCNVKKGREKKWEKEIEKGEGSHNFSENAQCRVYKFEKWIKINEWPCSSSIYNQPPLWSIDQMNGHINLYLNMINHTGYLMICSVTCIAILSCTWRIVICLDQIFFQIYFKCIYGMSVHFLDYIWWGCIYHLWKFESYSFPSTCIMTIKIL